MATPPTGPDTQRQALRAVGRRVAELRGVRGLTQDGLAEKLGCSVDRVQRIERGANLTLRSLLALAAVLDCPPAALFEAPAALESKAGRPRRP